MTITRDELARAAFWGDTICLNCGAPGEIVGEACSMCGETKVFDAAGVVEVLELVIDDEAG